MEWRVIAIGLLQRFEASLIWAHFRLIPLHQCSDQYHTFSNSVTDAWHLPTFYSSAVLKARRRVFASPRCGDAKNRVGTTNRWNNQVGLRNIRGNYIVDPTRSAQLLMEDAITAPFTSTCESLLVTIGGLKVFLFKCPKQQLFSPALTTPAYL